jgi:hypothetical protein
LALRQKFQCCPILTKSPNQQADGRLSATKWKCHSSCGQVAHWHILHNAKVGHQHDQLESVPALY